MHFKTSLVTLTVAILTRLIVSCEASISEMKEQLKQSEESVRLLSSELDALQQEHMQLTVIVLLVVFSDF